MSKVYEIEYCNLELRFERRQIQNFIAALIEEGYSLYWNENERYFIISVRSGRKLVKLKFEREKQRFKMVGNYVLKDLKLAEMMEKLIEEAKGHAVVKRFRDDQILIENIMFGEIIRTVEITGVKHKVVFQKQPLITMEEVLKAFRSDRAEQRIPAIRLELDYELAVLNDLLVHGEPHQIEAQKQRLELLRKEILTLECMPHREVAPH